MQSNPPLWSLLPAPIAAKFTIGDEIRIVAGHLRNVKLCHSDVRDGLQVTGVLTLGEGREALFLGIDLRGSVLGWGRKRLPLFEHGIKVAAQLTANRDVQLNDVG